MNPFHYIHNKRESGVRCRSLFSLCYFLFYGFWIRHFSFIYIGYV
nr:MAG TPA_asm: hypothetical protein [Caudoviricetes sp.]